MDMQAFLEKMEMMDKKARKDIRERKGLQVKRE